MMKWQIVLTYLTLLQSRTFSATIGDCQLPEQWNGRWFQSGASGPITVNGSVVTDKGRCVANVGDKFLMRDEKYSCWRCMVIHERHPNVLQYKETYCLTTPQTPFLENTCSQLTGDAQLISLFRSGAAPSACPITGPMEFTYTLASQETGEKDCNSPMSHAETCTQESRLFLRYQACPNVHASQSDNIELECLATWKDGSTLYMVGRLHAKYKNNDEEIYRCFILEHRSNNTWYLAQSADASCSGLNSVNDGERTLKMKPKNSPKPCSYPSWLEATKHWVALDRTTPRLLTSTYNLTILDRNETQLVCHGYVPFDDRHFSFFNHHSPAVDQPSGQQNHVRLIARATQGCQNGYVCLVFHRRDKHLIEMQQSKWSQEHDEVCGQRNFNPNTTPYTTFIASDQHVTRECPYLGRYQIVQVVFPSNTEPPEEVLVLNENGVKFAEVYDSRVTSAPSIGGPRRGCHQESVHRMDIGCKEPDRIRFATSCEDETFSEYQCHGTWVENDTAYLVASTEAGRYCLVYSASTSATDSRELFVTGHLASCPRASHRHSPSWQVNLTSYAQCDAYSSALSWTSNGPSTLIRFLVFCTLIGEYWLAR